MYIPILKFRQTEKGILKNYNDLFSDNIIPLVEIFSEDYKSRFETDPKTGKRLYDMENGHKKFRKIPPTEDDICTIPNLVECIDDKKVFVDYLRIDEKKYNPFDKSKASLGISLRDFDSYQKKLLNLDHNEQFIPVVSTRKAFTDDPTKLINLINELKTKYNSVAFRVTADSAIYFSNVIQSLEKQDYLLFDVEETNYKSLILELNSLNSLTISCTKIILNSPRHTEFQNKDFEENAYTNLINNSLLIDYSKIGFNGFGDYCGYKDVLPSEGIAIKGSALCLIYDFNVNKFWSFANKNTSLGVNGYDLVKSRAIKKSKDLNPNNDCLAYEKITAQTKIHSHTFWIQSIIVRYIDQINKNITKI